MCIINQYGPEVFSFSGGVFSKVALIASIILETGSFKASYISDEVFTYYNVPFVFLLYCAIVCFVIPYCIMDYNLCTCTWMAVDSAYNCLLDLLPCSYLECICGSAHFLLLLPFHISGLLMAMPHQFFFSVAASSAVKSRFWLAFVQIYTNRRNHK